MRGGGTRKLSEAAASMRHTENLSQRNSPLHDMSAVAKIISTVAYIVCVVSFGRYDVSGLVPFFAYPIWACAVAGIPIKILFMRSLAALPFVAFAGLANVFFDSTRMSLPFGLSISLGWISFLVLCMKAFLTVSAAIILSSTTPIFALAEGLKKLKIPCVIVLQFTMTVRYIDILCSEAVRITQAYSMRSAGANVAKFSDWPKIAGNLFLRSLDRAENVYACMSCRGFSARDLSAFAGENPSYKDILCAAAFSALCVSFRAFNIAEFFGGIFV